MTPRLPAFVLVPVLLAGCSGSAGNRPALERAVNSVTAPRTSSPPRRVTPDPAFVNLKWGPLALAPGAEGTAELDVVNRGEQTAGPFRVSVYATPGRVVTANRTLLGSTELGSLAGQPQHVVVRFAAPAAPGSYAVGIEIDDRRQVAGDDRGNNTSAPAQLIVK